MKSNNEKKQPLIDVIIVNWNSGRQLYDCLVYLQSVKKGNYHLNRVCVVDNASTDQSMKNINTINLPLEIIENTDNLGFGAAVNQAINDRICDYVLLLNPDTKVFEESLSLPIEFLERPENSNVGIVGIQNVDQNGKVMRTCARFPTPIQLISKSLGLYRLFPKKFNLHFMMEWDHNDSRAVDHVMGSFFMLRHKIWKILEGFDEIFFMYLEDLDFSKRAHGFGYTSMYLCEAQVYHRGGGTSDQIKAKRLFYSLRSTILYVHKHFDKYGAWLSSIVTIFIEPWTRIGLSVSCRRPTKVLETLQGYCMLYSDLLNIWHAICRISRK